MDSHRTIRICITGAECTGKTTLARALGELFESPVVEEYGRDYFAEKLGRGDATVFAGDIVRVIGEQSRREDEAGRVGAELVFCDTDVFTIAVWHERFLGGRHAEIDELAEMRRREGAGPDLYLLCLPDFPFVPDDVRTGEPLRTAMHDVFVDQLTLTGRRYVELVGPHEVRLVRAAAAIERLVRESR